MASEIIVAKESKVSPLNAIGGINQRSDGWYRDSNGILRPPKGWTGEVQSNRQQADIRDIKNNEKEQNGHPQNYTGEKEKVAYLGKLGLNSEEAKETINAVNSWSWTGFKDVRLVQNGKKAKDESDSTARRRGRVLENFIKASPKWSGGDTFRGIALKDSEIKRLKVGGIIDMMGTSSWTTSTAEAVGFAKTYAKGGRKQCLFLCKDKQKHATSLRPLSPMAFEKEVIASKDAKYSIESIGTAKRLPGVTVFVVKSV